MPVEEGPFYAVELGATLLNTQGGPRRNGKAQVIGLDGYPIEGLFSGGELGSIFADMYNGGGDLGATIVFVGALPARTPPGAPAASSRERPRRPRPTTEKLAAAAAEERRGQRRGCDERA